MTGLREILRKKKNLTALIVCVLGVVLNIVLGAIVSALGLPLYLDTVGTVAVAIMGGYLPGVLVGFVTNIIKAITDPSSIYYGVLNVLIAASATFMARRGYFKKIKGIVVSIVFFTLIGGGLGGLIPWFMEGITYDSESLSGVLYNTGYFDLFSSHLISSMLQDLPDKAITVALVLIILRIVPERLYSYCNFTIWMQEQLPDEALYRKDGTHLRVMSLKRKALLVLGFAMTTVALACMTISVRVYRRSILNEHSQLALGTAALAASVVDGDRIDKFIEYGYMTKGYAEIARSLENILDSSPEIAYLYVYKIEDDGFRVVFDVETDDAPAGVIGSLIPYDDGFIPYIPQLKAGAEVEPIVTNDEYGYLLTAAKPVKNSAGQVVCYAIADVDMMKLVSNGRSFLVELITVFLGFFILLCAFVIWLINYHILFPIKSITDQVDDFSLSDESQEKLDSYVKDLRKLNIHTGDEIEKLYTSICRMTKTHAEQTRSIRQLSYSTTKMQDGLIITMADMVENRDSDTGAHVQKTSAYVKIIVEGLKKKGYYSEKITPKFISDVVRSAPLHDVGKIHVPDGILNKPGKLTPEEYEIMKTHTVSGKKIMEDAISTFEGENYLKEARNMAAYHHERWDGKGYPEELHGEVIPLSARIMAVADVFDALTSPRIYKEPYPLDTALSIIKDGSGTQFDPKCVEVLLDSIDEVKVILRKYNGEA